MSPEQFTLNHLPKITDLKNGIPWINWLKTNTQLRQETDDVQLFQKNQECFLTYKNHVLHTYTTKEGLKLFHQLQNQRKRKEVFTTLAHWLIGKKQLQRYLHSHPHLSTLP